MSDALWAMGEALTLGIATAMNPCPMATSVAAIAFIGRRLDSPRLVFFAGILYALGSTIAYVALATLVLAGVHASPIAWLLTHYVYELLGPFLILLGMLLLGMLWPAGVSLRLDERFHAHVERLGLWSALPLGMLFALAFCPASAAFFFGSLFRMAAQRDSWLVLPLCYGIGAALPVVLCASLLAVSARWLGMAFRVMAGIGRWAQRIAGALLILVGVYLSLRYIFHAF